MELLLGAGTNHKKRLKLPDESDDWSRLVTLDVNSDCSPDVVADAGGPLPFRDSTFDSVSAYHLLEHLGQQGDYKTFFRQFDEYARVTKIGGHFFGICPSWKSMWAWGDPGHCRVITSGTLSFLDRQMYADVGLTTMTDYRFCYQSDWQIVDYMEDDSELAFVLRLRSKGNSV